MNHMMHYYHSPGRNYLLMMLVCLSLLAASVVPQNVWAADGDIVDCTVAYNMSQSEGFGSGDPTLVADPAGLVHLFWAERVTGAPFAVPNIPDGLIYTFWNGTTWSEPVDIFLSPQEIFNRRIGGIRALLDDERILHLLWQGPENTLFYSNSPADEAWSASAWQEPVLLTAEESGAQFSAHMAYEPPATLHVTYGQGFSNTANRSVVYIRSTDGGQSWSDPITLYAMAALGRGASNVRLLVDTPRLYATWTEWDLTGNGQGVYFARSNDGGLSWDEPVLLDARRGDEYERDWTTLAVLGEDELVAFWEGGWRAYRQAQYSYNGGVSWTEPVDTLDWLIADNGFAEFARDSAGRLHLFVFQRVREGNTADKGDLSGLWHTAWEGGTTWREPVLVGEQTPGNLVSVAISGGNQLFAASTSTADYEIWVRQCMIEGAPAIPPASAQATGATKADGGSSAIPAADEPTEMPVAADPTTPAPSLGNVAPVAQAPVAETPLLMGLLGPMILIVATTVFYLLRQRRHS